MRWANKPPVLWLRSAARKTRVKASRKPLSDSNHFRCGLVDASALVYFAQGKTHRRARVGLECHSIMKLDGVAPSMDQSIMAPILVR